MAEIKRIKRQRLQDASIDLGEGDTITIVFDMEAVTPRWMNDTLTKMQAENVLALGEAVAAVIVSWDVTDEGNPYPPTSENISNLSFATINRLYEQVCRSSGPSDAEGNASPPSVPVPSSATSEPGSQTSPNGSATSPSPTLSASLPVT